MSMNELETKCRELRQLQALIQEAQTEAEAIKDAICDLSLLSGIRRYFYESRITDNEPAE